jgi:curved DNA-binding protein CbpA
MQTATYYATLGLAPNAPPEVIRAAFKALVLIYHPDKTFELPAADRVAHVAVFRKIQEAFDVLSKPNLKAAYDAELARHDGNVDEELSIFHHRAPSTPKRKTPVKLTTPEEKEAIVARARQQVEYLRKQRAKRLDDDADMDITELKRVANIWYDLADENDADPTIQAHCTIRAHEYQEKVLASERQYEEWLKKMSTSKHAVDTAATAATPAKSHKKELRPLMPNAPENAITPSTPNATAQVTRLAPLPSPSLTSRIDQHVAEHNFAADKRKEEAKARAEIRRARKIQIEAAKQAKIEQKAALVRAEKESQRGKVEEQARLYAERIAKARAKVHAPSVGTDHDGLLAHEDTVEKIAGSRLGEDVSLEGVDKNVQEDFKLCANKTCTRCGLEHEGFRDWNNCRVRVAGDNQDTSMHHG